jgi:hypothetical protein
MPEARSGTAAADAALDAEMDRVLIDSFPASDPPQWDSLAAGRPVLRPASREPGEIEATAPRH